MRTRFAVLALAVIAVTLAASFFVREIAVTESLRFQIAFYAATVRFAMVFVASLYAIASVSREFQDKGLDVTLALDLPRSHYILGKLSGFLAIALVLSLLSALPLVAFVAPEAALQWAASLSCELAIVVALSLFCVVTFNALMPAASIVACVLRFRSCAERDPPDQREPHHGRRRTLTACDERLYRRAGAGGPGARPLDAHRVASR